MPAHANPISKGKEGFCISLTQNTSSRNTVPLFIHQLGPAVKLRP